MSCEECGSNRGSMWEYDQWWIFKCFSCSNTQMETITSWDRAQMKKAEEYHKKFR